MQIPHRRQRQRQQDEISKDIRRGPDDEEERRIDAGAAARDGLLVPDELDRAALEGADKDDHDGPANGKDADDVGEDLEVAQAAEDADVEEEDGDFDDGD